MKTGYTKLALSVALTLITVNVALAFKADAEKSKTVTETFKVSPSDILYLKSTDSEVNVETWAKQELEVKIIINVRANDDESAMEFLDNASPTIERVSDGVKVTSFICGSIQSFNNKMKVKFNGDRWINIRDFTVDVMVKMPETMQTDLDLSYTIFTGPDFKGRMVLDAYDSKIEMGNIAPQSILDVQYGRLKVGNVEKPEKLKFYEIEFNAGNIDEGKIKSSYSVIRTGNWSKLQLESYEDQFTLGNVDHLTGKATYSKIEGGIFKMVDLNIYESRLTTESSDEMKLHSQYCRIVVDKVGRMIFDQSYEDNLELGVVGDLVIKGQYTGIEAQGLTGKLEADFYECGITVARVAKSVSAVIVDGSYNRAEFTVDSDVVYDVEADFQYPDLDLDEGDFQEPLPKAKNDKLVGTFRNKDGSSKRTLFKVSGYEGSVSIGS